jgi:hypothetical protein
LALATIALLRIRPFEPVRVIAAEGRTVYQPSAWWVVMIALPAAVMLLIGIALLTQPHRLGRMIGVVVLIAAAGSAAVIAPTVLVGELVVTPDGFSHTTGIWWAPETRTMEFDSVKRLRVVSQRTETGPSFSLECHGRDGQVVVIPKSTVLEAGLSALLTNAAQRGVSVWPPVVGPEEPD